MCFVFVFENAFVLEEARILKSCYENAPVQTWRQPLADGQTGLHVPEQGSRYRETLQQTAPG